MDNAPFPGLVAEPVAEQQAPAQEVPQEEAIDATPVTDYVPQDQPVGAAPEKDEIERLLEDPSIPLSLESGTPFTLRQLRMREMLRLLRIISRGSAAMLGEINLNFEDPDEFVQTFIALIVFAIPEAEDETIDFVQSMVDPVLSGDAKKDAEARMALLEELSNPDLEDIVTILSAIVAHEGRDLAALGKRLRSLLTAARKMGQVPDALTPVVGG